MIKPAAILIATCTLLLPGCRDLGPKKDVAVHLEDRASGMPLRSVLLKVHSPIRLWPSFPVASARTGEDGNATLRMPDGHWTVVFSYGRCKHVAWVFVPEEKVEFEAPPQAEGGCSHDISLTIEGVPGED
jgi:hypothetical protein